MGYRTRHGGIDYMKHIILLVPTSIGVGLTAVSTGVARALKSQGLRAHYFKPVTLEPNGDETISMKHVEHLLGENRLSELLETIIEIIFTLYYDYVLQFRFFLTIGAFSHVLCRLGYKK